VFTQGQGTRNPIIQSFTANPTNVTQGQPITFQALAHDPDNQPLQFNWTATSGTLSTNTGQVVSWIPPAQPGTYTVMVTVTNGRGGFATGAHNLIVQADGSAKIGVTPMASAPPTVVISPSATVSPVASPLSPPSVATSPMASLPPQVAPSPTMNRPATVTTVKNLPAGLEHPNWVSTRQMKVMPGTSTLYFPNVSDAPYRSKFGTVDSSLNISVSPTSIDEPVFEFGFVGDARYYVGTTHIVKPDGSSLPIPSDERTSDLEIVGRYAYSGSGQWNCIFRTDLETGETIEFAGVKGGRREHRNGVGKEVQFIAIQDVAYNAAANALFVLDDTRIRKLTLAGEVSDFVGLERTHNVPPLDGKGSAARLNRAYYMVSDDAGNLFFTEFDYGTLRMVTPEGEVTTIAGKPRTMRTRADGTGAEAAFANPLAISFGKFNTGPALFIGDGNHIRIATGW
jgi:hypothetical protein